LGAQAVYGFGSVNNSLKYDEKAADSEGLAAQKKPWKKKKRFPNSLASVHLPSIFSTAEWRSRRNKTVTRGAANLPAAVQNAIWWG
jgi:hypothetical protein